MNSKISTKEGNCEQIQLRKGNDFIAYKKKTLRSCFIELHPLHDFPSTFKFPEDLFWFTGKKKISGFSYPTLL